MLSVLNHLTVLHVQTANLDQVTGRSVIVSQELRNDGQFLVSIDGGIGAVEGARAHSVRVVVAAVFVADALVLHVLT